MVTFFKEIPAIENGKITEVVPKIIPRDTDEIFDATDLVLLPGVIVPQVCFCSLGLEHKKDLYTASLACAKGGVLFFRNAQD